MKGEINTNGILSIKRGSSYKVQACPFCSLYEDTFSYSHDCGDWCPQFSEPTDGTGSIDLWICHNKCLQFEKLTDYREGVNNGEEQGETADAQQVVYR